MENYLKQNASLISLIEQVASQIVDDRLKKDQYQVPDVQDHDHNGSNAAQIDVNNLVNKQLSTRNGGVVSPDTLFDTVPQTVEGMPIPGAIIYGNGVGTASQFNGGTAPPGTIMIFMNMPVAAQIWWRAYNLATNKYQWFGVDVSAGAGNNALALGPMD